MADWQEILLPVWVPVLLAQKLPTVFPVQTLELVVQAECVLRQAD
jgi:hypothetical protein